MVIATIFASYVALGGGAFWFFGGLDGASRDTHTQTRGEWLEQAVQRCKLAAGELESAKALADRAREHWQMLVDSANSEANHRQAETSRLLAIDPGRLYPDEFERFVAEVFRHLGFTCDVIGQSGDQGVDVIASKGTTRLAIQAKRYIGGVGNTAVQQVYAGMAHHRCQRCLVVTTGEFTSAAITLAQSTGCILIGTDRISELIRGEITF
jgi:HJR/Mrr/RecB family endonuclease